MAASSPAWLVEALDVFERRAALLRSVVAAACVVGALLAVLAPDLVPPRPVVGAAVALAAILLGVAVTVAVDAGDATVRGPRHVRAVGGELVGVLPTAVASAAADDLAASVLAAREGRRVVLGLGPAARGVDTSGWTDALAVALAARGASVLSVDLAAGPTPNEGLLEVVRDGASLGRTVSFERDVKLARLGAGRDLDGAIGAAAELPTRLPKDLEVLLLALPPVDGDVLTVAAALDAVLLLARSDATPRVRLQAAIEAVEGVGTTAQVVLVDDRAAGGRADRPAAWGPDQVPPRPDDPATRDRDVPAEAAARDDAAAGEAADDVPEDVPAAAPAIPGADESPVDEAAVDEAAVDETRGDAPGGEALVDDLPVAQAPEQGPVAAVPPTATPVAAGDAPTDATPATATGAAGDDATPTGATEDAAASGDETPAQDLEPGPDPWAGPRSTPRAELGRSPAPAVRVVRDLPTTRRPVPASLPDPPAPATPRDPDLVSGAAAAGLAARLGATGSPPSAPAPIVDHATTAEGAPAEQPASAGEPVVDPVDGEPAAEEPEAAVESVDEDAPTEGPEAAVEPVVDDAPAEEPPVEEPPLEEPEAAVEPVVEDAPQEAPDAAVGPADAGGADEDEVVDPTDEIPAVRDARRPQADADDDPLRTTAQLALLVDQLNERQRTEDGSDADGT